MRASTRGVVAELRAVADPSRLSGMAHVGINVDRALGVSIPNLRKLGRRMVPIIGWRSISGGPASMRPASWHPWSTTPPR